MTAQLYIGLMSGTSMDAIDAVLVEFGERRCTIHGTFSAPYPADLRQALTAIVRDPDATSLPEVASCHARVARIFAGAVAELLATTDVAPDQVAAIGSHGQTVLHAPQQPHLFSVQLGDPGTLAALTGITIVADFRNTDIALGGQGAPLTPAFHRWAFAAADGSRAVVNIGGIANVTILGADGSTAGFDTGPGNTLLDHWYRQQRGQTFDADGAWAAGGQVNAALLAAFTGDPYFSHPPPKSTGLDHFNLQWLLDHLRQVQPQPSPQDVQSTLAELTAAAIADALRGVDRLTGVVVCGGGARNGDLVGRLKRLLSPCPVHLSDHWGLDPECVEPVAFAWLARERLRGAPTSIPSVTGAREAASLGGVYLPGGGL